MTIILGPDKLEYAYLVGVLTAEPATRSFGFSDDRHYVSLWLAFVYCPVIIPYSGNGPMCY